MDLVRRGNGVETRYSYDNRQRLASLLSTVEANGVPTALQDITYTFNAADSITAMENRPMMDPEGAFESTIQYSYAYDGLNRLVRAEGSYKRSLHDGMGMSDPAVKFARAYGYAPSGNLTRKDILEPESGALEDRWSYGYTNHAVTGIHSSKTGAERLSMSYDACGNMVRQADHVKNLIKELSYDSSNRIKRLTDPNTGRSVGEYWYDDQGFRVRKISRREKEGSLEEHNLLYPSKYFGMEIKRTPDGKEVSGSYSVVNHVYVNGVRAAALTPGGEALYYLTDQVDSVKVVVNDRGKPVTRTEYLPYGETWFTEGDEGNAPKFNSQELDRETNFYFYNARYYDPEIGRFVTADNLIPDELDTQGWNNFSYVRNNPVVFKDPTGHEWYDTISNDEASSRKYIKVMMKSENMKEVISKYTDNPEKDLLNTKKPQAKIGHKCYNIIIWKNPAEKLGRPTTIKYPIITSGYTDRRKDPFNKKPPKAHHGLDISSENGSINYLGSDLQTMGAGRVTRIRTDAKKGGGGKLVEIDYGHGRVSAYYHMDDIFVKEGQWINKGHIVGAGGSTGKSTAPHLHLEMRSTKYYNQPIGKSSERFHKIHPNNVINDPYKRK